MSEMWPTLETAMKTLKYDSGCEMTERPPTPGKWDGTVFRHKDGTKWTFDPTGPDPREDDTGTHELQLLQVPAIFEKWHISSDGNGGLKIEAPAPLLFKHGFDDPVCECELAKVRNPNASECLTCKRMVPLHDRFWNYVRRGTKMRHPEDGLYQILSVSPNEAETSDGDTKSRLYLSESEVVK